LVLGVRYDPEQPLIVRETIAHLIFGDSSVWEAIRESRNKPMPLLKGMGYVVTLAFTSVAHVMKMLAAEPARRKRAEEREREVAVVKDEPAHILAFGQAFDPVLSEPVHPMRQMLAQGTGGGDSRLHFNTPGAQLNRGPSA
jgi:cellulose synthase (UDP-forming)